jgi:hypothetical protein
MNAGAAESAVSSDRSVVTTFFYRTGEQLQAPHVLTYQLAEYIEQRGRWTFPDIGAYDEGQSGDKLLFLGAGVDLHPGKHVLLTQELYFSQETGPGSRGARSLWVWPVLDVRLAPRLTAQAVAYPTIPLNRSAQAGFDVDRAKMEYALRRNLTVGPGYSSSKSAGSAWQNKPFLTTTVSTRAGSLEFWLERMPGGGQIQARYKLVHTRR